MFRRENMARAEYSPTSLRSHDPFAIQIEYGLYCCRGHDVNFIVIKFHDVSKFVVNIRVVLKLEKLGNVGCDKTHIDTFEVEHVDDENRPLANDGQHAKSIRFDEDAGHIRAKD